MCLPGCRGVSSFSFQRGIEARRECPVFFFFERRSELASPLFFFFPPRCFFCAVTIYKPVGSFFFSPVMRRQADIPPPFFPPSTSFRALNSLFPLGCPGYRFSLLSIPRKERRPLFSSGYVPPYFQTSFLFCSDTTALFFPLKKDFPFFSFSVVFRRQAARCFPLPFFQVKRGRVFGLAAGRE